MPVMYIYHNLHVNSLINSLIIVEYIEYFDFVLLCCYYKYLPIFLVFAWTSFCLVHVHVVHVFVSLVFSNTNFLQRT